jgi:hypothetical protein
VTATDDRWDGERATRRYATGSSRASTVVLGGRVIAVSARRV